MLSTGEATSIVLCPVLGFPLEERHGQAGESSDGLRRWLGVTRNKEFPVCVTSLADPINFANGITTINLSCVLALI